MPVPPRPLPAALGEGPFTLARAAELGVGRERLRRADVERVRPGVHRRRVPARADAVAPSGPPPTSALTPGERLRLEALLAMWSAAAASHATAARVQGMWLPWRLRGLRAVHLTRPAPASAVQERGVRTHRRVLAGADVVHVGGVACTTPARTWRDLAGTLTRDELVVLGDWLVRSSGPGREVGLCTVEDLREAADRPGARHAVVAREAAALVRDGAHSPPETELRLALMAAGLPEPDLQIEVWDEEFSPFRPASADLGWRARRVVLQYEGGHHDDPVQVERDTLRDAAFLRSDHACLRASRSDRRQGFRATVDLARRELLRRGWRPGDPE